MLKVCGADIRPKTFEVEAVAKSPRGKETEI
jgi:hypothetical protein